MNFSPFGSPFPATIPAIHQFAAKFTQDAVPSALHQNQDNTGNSNRYTANGVPSFTQHHPATQQQQQQIKYQSGGYVNQGLYGGHHTSLRQDKRQPYDQELAQELCAAMLQHQHQDKHVTLEKTKQDTSQPTPLPQQTTGMPSAWQSLATPGSTVADYLSHLPASTLPLSLHHFLKYSAGSIKKETAQQVSHQGSDLGGLHGVTSGVNGLGGGSMGGNGGLGVNTNGLGSNIVNSLNTLSSNVNVGQLQGSSTSIAPPKKKKKKKPEKEKKPRPKPGEIRLTTALDGSTLFCCPECHMAYPEKELLEEHLVGHTLERRFVCDICGAGLKRKDHLTRHKQSHNPERPYVCTVCLKAFKRKEQLTLHFVIHSGEKRHICSECGKGFYRKDHLRKHTRSHIARRVKAELSQQGPVGVPAAHSQGVLS